MCMPFATVASLMSHQEQYYAPETGCCPVCEILSQRYLDAESFDKSSIASCTVVINCAGKMMVEFFSTDISAIVWRVRS